MVWGDPSCFVASLSVVGGAVYKYPTPKGTGSIPIVAKTKSSRVVVGARLLHVVDSHLRRKQRGRGDMSALIYQALREVDLGSRPAHHHPGATPPGDRSANQDRFADGCAGSA